MPKISSITTVSVPTLSDKLIGTSVGGTPNNQTNNFTLQQLKTLFDGGSPPASPNLQSVLNAGNTAAQSIYLTGTIESTNLRVFNDSNLKNLYLSERLFDKDNSQGTNGQYLTSTGAGVQWSTLTIAIPTLQQVLTAGNVSDKNITTTGNIQAAAIQATNITANSNLRVVGTLSDSTNSVGASGQVLSSTVTGTDWVDLPSYSAVSPLIYNNVAKQFSIQQATSTQNGYLSSADWVTFDGKQNAGNYITALTGEASALGPGSVSITLNNMAVINKTLTGLSVLSGTITSADSIISAFGKIQGQINGLVSGLTYKGVWNALTNIPTLASGIGESGEYYVVDVAGNTNLDGITDWAIGDWAIFNGSDWQKIDNSDLVTSVNGQIGTVVLTTDNINEGTTNLYYTNTRARNAISSLATGLTYTAGTGVFSFTAGYSIPTIANQTDWTTAYNRSIISAAVTGTTTKTLTLTQQDGGTITANWTDIAPVTSVFARTGAVVAQSGDYTTTLVTEGTNLYYLDSRARAAISSSATGLSYNSSTGDFSLTAGYSIPTNLEQADWDTAYNNSIVSASVTGTSTKTLTLNQQDGGTITADWTDVDTGLTSVGVSMPSAFNVSNSPLTSNGTIAITGAGTNLQYVDGTGALQTFPSLTGFVTLDTNQTITGLKTIIRSGDVIEYKIGNDTLYGLKLFYSQNELVPSGEATWSFVNTFNRDGSGFDVTPLSFFRGILVTGSRLLSSSVNANLLDYYGNNPTGRYPVYVYNTGVQQFASGIIVGETSGVVNALTGAISDLPSGVMANFKGRVIGSNAVNSNEFATLSQITGGYVPYTGATQNVNLGTYGLLSDFVQFNLAPTSLPTVQGTMYWDSDKETVDVVLNGTTGSIFQDTFFFVKNQTGASIPKGTVVRANGTVGSSGRILATPFLADGSFDSKFCLGVTTELINNGEDGRVTYFGSIRGIDTSMYAAGTVLYASPTVVGGFTATEPNGPTNNIISVAIVVNSSINNGSIFVRPTFIPSAIDISKSLNYTPANQATTLTINGTTYNLSANRSWSVGTVTSIATTGPITGGPITGSGTIGITQATSTIDGYLSSTDWATFNSKQNAITLNTTPSSGPATLISDVLTIPVYQAQGNYITALTGEATASGPGSASVTLSNSAVTGKVLTGLNVTGSVILDTDSILVAFGKLQNQVNQLVGGLKYDGTWNAATNTPTITSGVGTDGDFYIVNVAGTTSIDGINDWQVGDWIVFHTPAWQKVDNSDSVSSVFGRVGNITAAQSDYSAFYPLIADIKNGVLTVQGDGVLGGSGTFSANQATNATISITHDAVSRTNTTSTQSPSFGGTFTAIDSITSSTEGHITAVNTKTVTIPNTTSPNNATITLSAGSGISGGGDFTTDQSFNETITLSHGATSSQPSVNNSGRTFIQDITLDAFGHVTGLVSATDSDTFTGTVTSVSGAGGYGGLTLSGTVTTSGNITLGGTPSGTWPISISGNAETVDGFSASQSTIGNGIVVRDVNGYIFGNYINMSDDGNPGGGTSISSFITKQGDNYYRSVSPANAMVSIRNNASGTWGINVTGSASSATTANNLQTYFLGNGSVNVADGTSRFLRTENGNGAVLSYSPVLHAAASDTMWQIQGTFGTSGNGTMYFRQGYAGSWGNWITMISSANIGNQSVSSAGYASQAGFAATASSAGYASTVQVNYNNDSNSNYQMLWGSGNSVYGTGNIYCNPATDTVFASAFRTEGSNSFAQVTNNAGGYPGFIASIDYGWAAYTSTIRNDNIRATYVSGGDNFESSFNGFGYYTSFYGGNASGSSSWSASQIGGGAYGSYWQHSGNYLSSQSFGPSLQWNAYSGNGDLYIGGVIYQNQYSDIAFKDNVTPIENALDKVKAIGGVEFDWNEYAKEQSGKEGRDVGVIAQSVQSVYPFAVREYDREDNDKIVSHLVVDYDKLNPLALQAIKELAAIVDELKAEIQTLKSK